MSGYISVSADALKVRVKPDDINVIITGSSSGINIGSGVDVYASVSSNTLQFRRISGSTVTQSGDTIYVSATASDTSNKVNISGDTMTGDLTVPKLILASGNTGHTHVVGGLHWDDADGTVSLGLLNDVHLQLGEENIVFGILNEDLTDGDIVSSYGFSTGGTVLFGKADTSLFEYTGNDIGVMTSSGISGDTGYVTIFGKVRGLDTSAWSASTVLWLSNVTRGLLTNVEPTYPDQKIPIAFVAKQHATEGELLVNPSLDLTPQINNLQYYDDFFIGSFIDKITMDTFESGGTVYITVEKDVVSGSTDFRVLIGTDSIITYSAQTIALIAGTEAIPVLNFVSMGATGIQVNTGWFTGNVLDTDGPFAAVATVLVQDVPNVAIEGVYKLHGWIDRLLTDNRGDSVKTSERLRQEDAQWDNGVLPTVIRSAEALTVDRLDISTTIGIIYQKNRNIMPIRTTVGDGILLHVVDGNPNYYPINHLGEVTGQTDGTAWANNVRVNFVVWGISSQNGVDCKLMVNTCSGVYASDDNAVEDANNYSSYNIPKEYLGTGFLIARISAKYNTASNGTWTLIQTEDLRGRIIGTVGGGASGTGAAIAVKNSIERDVDLIYQLVNDEVTPSPNYVYGVDSGSTRGYQDITSNKFITISGDTTLLNTWNGRIVRATEVSGGTSTGFTVTIPSGLTTGFNLNIVNYLETGIITFASEGTLLSRDSAVTMVDQYGGVYLFNEGNDTHIITGDIV